MGSSPNDSWYVSWEAMNARAWWYLNHSGAMLPPVGRGQLFRDNPRLRLWDDAGDFGCEKEPMTLTVFELYTEDGDELGPVVREAVWRRSADLSRMHAAVSRTKKTVIFKPTVVVRDGAVPAEQLSHLLREVSTYQVPVVWLDPLERITSDVGAIGFEFFSGDQPPAVLRLQWSDGKPAVWEPVAEWCGRLRQFLESCLSNAAQDTEHS